MKLKFEVTLDLVDNLTLGQIAELQEEILDAAEDASRVHGMNESNIECNQCTQG